MSRRHRMSVAEAEGCVASYRSGAGNYNTDPSARILQGILKRSPAVRSNTLGAPGDIRRYRSEYSLAMTGQSVDADAPFPRKTSGSTRKLYDRRAAASLKLTTVGAEWALNACEGHTRWANDLLKGRCPQITDLRKSVSNGTTLANIVEVLTREKFPGVPAGKLSSASEKAGILQQCVDRLHAHGVDLQGVNAHELASGNLKSTLMLMTNIRKKYDVDYSEQDVMGERTPGGSPHPSRSVPSTLGQASSSQHPTGVTQSGARQAIGSRRPPPSDDIIPGTIRHSNTSHLVSASDQNPYGTSQYGREHQQFYQPDNHYMAAPVPPTRTSKSGSSQKEAHPPPTSATQAWLTTSLGVKSHGMAQNRGTDVGRSPALERRVNLRTRSQSPAGVVNGAFNYEEGDLLSPPVPLPPRARSVQGGAQNLGVRGGYSREGEDNGDSYVPSRPNDSAIYGLRPPSAQNRTQQPVVSEAMSKPPQIPPKYLPPPQYSPYGVTEVTGETADTPVAPANDMRSACSKLYTTTNYTQMNGTCSPHPVPKYPSGIYSNVHARQTPSGSSGSPQSYSSQLSPTLKRHDADRLRRYSQQSSPQEEEWKPMTPSMSRNQFSSNQYVKPAGDMTPTMQRRINGNMTPTTQRRMSGDTTPTSHRRVSCVTFSDGKGVHTNSLTKGHSRENSLNGRLAEGQTQHSPARTSTGENRYVNFSNGQNVQYNSLERRRGTWSSSPAPPSKSTGKAQGGKQEVADMLRTVGNPAGAECSRTGVNFSANTNSGVPKPGGQLSSEQQYKCQQMSPCARRPPVSLSTKDVTGKQLSPRSQLTPGSGHGNSISDAKKLYNSLVTDDDDNFSVSSMSDTPPLPTLSPDNTPPTTPPLTPRHKVATHLATPDVVNSATKETPKCHLARKSGGQVSLKTWDGRGKRVNPRKAASRGTRSKSAGTRVRSYGMLEDVVESDDFGGSTTNMSNTEDGLDETTLTSREMRTMRRQMEGLEAMYLEMLKAVGLDKEYGAGSRHSISSASSMARSTRRFGRQSQQHKHHRELKQVNKRFARLESHVVTLARSVAHLSSEVHSQNTLRQDIEALKIDIQDVRKDVKVVGGKTPLNEWERFRGWVPSLTNPKRVKKLTKFFGQEPPLLHIFLRKLNYEKYIPKFDAEKITMVELPYMTEEMLQKIGIPLGPSRRILQEAQMCFRQENFNIYIV